MSTVTAVVNIALLYYSHIYDYSDPSDLPNLVSLSDGFAWGYYSLIDMETIDTLSSMLILISQPGL